MALVSSCARPMSVLAPLLIGCTDAFSGRTGQEKTGRAGMEPAQRFRSSPAASQRQGPVNGKGEEDGLQFDSITPLGAELCTQLSGCVLKSAVKKMEHATSYKRGRG